jgi:hypothetical protein
MIAIQIRFMNKADCQDGLFSVRNYFVMGQLLHVLLASKSALVAQYLTAMSPKQNAERTRRLK